VISCFFLTEVDKLLNVLRRMQTLPVLLGLSFRTWESGENLTDEFSSYLCQANKPAINIK